ncbi:MAG: glycosyl hydrolase family 18 protein [Candidatus Dormibacteraeota bacterium]|nr:glycosyl hydrolase family 18 protein [Candidatus Dormibacteraeota bacterium]
MRASLFGLSLLVMWSALAAAGPAAAANPAATVPGPHVLFDDTTGRPAVGLVPGAKASSLTHTKATLARPALQPNNTAATAPASPGAPPDPEVLGFVQQGEVASGAWSNDLRLNLLSTVAYFGVNVNADGTLVTGDSGYSTWWSSQVTNLINAAHSAGDRVVLTIKAFNDSTIAGSTGSEQSRQTLINAIINQVVNRPADGVNIDFEGVSSGLRANFTTFISELQAALNGRAAGRSYLTADTYASAGQGGTMYDLAALWHHVDALDLMGYGFAPCVSGHSGPTAPMGGCWYNVTQAVSDYMTRYGVPAGELLLGVPYYGYKWSVSTVTAAGQDPTTSGSSADTYAGAVSDFSCAQQLQQHWDATFQEPWASWYSPPSGDPCGGNYGSYRELYYDNAQSLGIKYDLVNNRGLRGIAIWALGYDGGSNDLWNEITAKFTVTKFPPFKPKGVGPPSVTVLPDGSQQLVFWNGFSNHLFEGWYAGGYWHGPIDLTNVLGPAAILQSAPSVAVTPDGSTQTVYWAGSGGHLFEAWWAGARWNGPIDVTAGALGPSAQLASAPSVAMTPDGSTQGVFWKGPGGHLYEAWWAGGRWNGPSDWTATAFGGRGVMTSAPSTTDTPDGSSQLVFWAGPGGHLYEAWWAGARWNGPVDFTADAFGGAAPLTSSPSATVLPNGSQQLVFWTGPGGHLFQAWWAGGRWNGPADWTSSSFRGVGPLTSAPSVAVLPDGSQQLVFWQGAGQTLWEAWYAGAWFGPADLSAG